MIIKAVDFYEHLFLNSQNNLKLKIDIFLKLSVEFCRAMNSEIKNNLESENITFEVCSNVPNF